MRMVGPLKPTYYLPDGEAVQSGGTSLTYNTYFMGEGERVAEDTGPAGTLTHQYFLNDFQNSIGLVTNDSATTLQNIAYDAFGRPRHPNGTVDPTWGASAITPRGYINQEMLHDVQLIDLNARYYDPALARFLTADPVISGSDDSQAWNAYAYSHNNPMSKADPTGLWFVPGACLCFGSGAQLNQEVGTIGEEQEIHLDFDVRTAQTIITAMQLQKSTRTPTLTVESGRLTSASDYLGINTDFLKDDSVHKINTRPTLFHPGPGEMMAFVGGFFDYSSGGPVINSYRAYIERTGNGAAYFTWDQAAALGILIDVSGGAVSVIGHSYGGDTAASVVAAGHSVDSLRTVDPVSWIRPNFSAVAAHAGTWIDINATGGHGSFPNFIAGIGGAWNSGPSPFSIFINVPYGHAGAMDFCGLPGSC